MAKTVLVKILDGEPVSMTVPTHVQSATYITRQTMISINGKSLTTPLLQSRNRHEHKRNKAAQYNVKISSKIRTLIRMRLKERDRTGNTSKS